MVSREAETALSTWGCVAKDVVTCLIYSFKPLTIVIRELKTKATATNPPKWFLQILKYSWKCSATDCKWLTTHQFANSLEWTIVG